MPPIPRRARTDGSFNFDPDAFFTAWAKEELTPYDNNFRRFIIRAFGLPHNDDYAYQAMTAEVTLLQVQTYIEFGAQGGLHSWYKDDNGQDVGLVFPVFSTD